jgi:hypothetical protein
MKSKKTNEIWYEETFCLQIAIDSGFAESCSELRISKLSLSLLHGYYETGNKLSDNKNCSPAAGFRPFVCMRTLANGPSSKHRGSAPAAANY